MTDCEIEQMAEALSEEGCKFNCRSARQNFYAGWDSAMRFLDDWKGDDERQAKRRAYLAHRREDGRQP